MDQHTSQYDPNFHHAQYNPGFSKPMMNPNSVNGNMPRPQIPIDQMAGMHLSSNKQAFPPTMVPSTANTYPHNNMQPHYTESPMPHGMVPSMNPTLPHDSQYLGQGAQVSTSQAYSPQSMPPVHSPFPPSFSTNTPNQNSYSQQANASSYGPPPPFPPTSASQHHGRINGATPPTSTYGPPQGMPAGYSAQQHGPPVPPQLGAANNTQYGPPFPPSGGMQQSQGPPPPPLAPSSGLPPPPPKSGDTMRPPPNSGAGPLPPQAQPIPRGPQAPAPGPPAPAQRRLNADQMPSAVQVIEDDRNNRSGEFNTGNRGQAPPLVTTNFVAVDQGNCNPRFMRSSLYNVPLNSDLLKQAGIPFSLTINPFAQLDEVEQAVPIGQVPTEGPVRCIRCKAYMCPFMTFIDGGRRFQCSLCGSTTEIPQDYFAHLDHTGRRTDCYQRPELCLGSYELLATKEYCRNEELPQAPAIIFMLDVSYNSFKSGLVTLFCQKIKEEILSYLPKEDYALDAESEVRVGFVTYDKQLHFYNLKSCLSQPQMQIVSDLDEVFVPLVDGFFVRVSEAEFLLDNLMEQIMTQFATTHQTETILAPVIEAGRQALEAAKRPGKLIVLHSSLPSIDAPGKLKNRDDRKLLGTDKEKTLLVPASPYYNTLGQKCVSSGCSVDIFLFPNAYIDIATISEVSKITGGNVYKYPYFQADLHAEALLSDLRQAVSEPRAFDCVMRVRTSTGTRPVEFYGNFYMSNTTDVEVGCFDRDKAVTVEIRHDDKLQENDVVFIQTAVLYTSVSGQRRLRIHNLSLSTTATLTELFRVADLDTAMNHLSKHTIQTLLTKSSRECREEIAAKCSHILAAYRKHCTYAAGNPGELILPEVMKLMPLYCNCLTKSETLQTMSDISTDDRSYNMFLLNNMDVRQSVAYLYPRVFPLHNLDPDSRRLPVAVRTSYERLEPNGAYLVENGVYLYLWLGANISSTWIQSVFSATSIAQLEPEKASILQLDNPISQRVRHILETIRSERPRYMKLHVVRQGDTLEHYFKRFMVEDRGDNGTPSYVDYLCHIHKEIRSLLN